MVDGSNGVMTWADYSGSGNDATQASGTLRPTVVGDGLNGKPVVRFNGSGQYLNLPNVMNGATAGEIFVVTKAAQAVPGSEHELMQFNSNPYTYGTIYPTSDGRLVDDWGSTTQQIIGVVAQPINQPHLYNVSTQSGLWVARINGLEQYRSTANTVSFTNTPLLGTRLLKDYTFAGDVAEVIVYDHVLSDDERKTVEIYLGEKYALASAPVTPTNLTTTVLAPSQVSLTWNGSPGNASIQYAIERKSTNGSFAALAVINDSATYIDTTVQGGAAYTYRVRAINYADISAYSNQSAVITPIAGANMPLTGIRLWLKADAGANTPVSSWADQSGLHNSARQGTAVNQPTLVTNALNGQPVVRFSGSGQYLTLPDAMSGAIAGEIFVVAKANQDVPSTGRLLMQFGANPYTYGAVYPWVDGKIYDDFGSSAQQVIGDVAQRLDQPHLYNITAESGSWTARINGQQQYHNTANSVTFAATPVLGTRLLKDYFFAGDIAEVLVYDHGLTAEERQGVERYFNGRYALVAEPPPSPMAFAAEAISATQTNLVWTGGLNTTEFVLERKSASNGEYVAVASFGPSRTGYIDNNLTANTEYRYRIRALGLAGFSAYSPELAVRTPSGAFSLPTNNLILWLRSGFGVSEDEDGGVEKWVDASGTGHDAVQASVVNRPTKVAGVLEGRSGLHFDGVNHFLKVDGNLNDFTNGLTALVVVKPTNAASYQRFFDFGNGAAADNIVFCRSGTSSDLLYSVFNGGWNGGTGAFGVGSITVGQFQMFGASQSGTTGRVFRNGQLLQLSSLLAIQNTPRLSNFVGKSNWGVNDPLFQGDILEVMIFSAELSEAQRQQVESYLSGRYGFGLSDVDTDLDGVGDWREFAIGTAASNPDTDGDGLTDGQEILLGTKPLVADTDGDGMPDGWEVAHHLNPLQNDAAGDLDGDGILNLQEFLQGSDPEDYYNGQAPQIQISSGDRQRGLPGTLVNNPLVVTVKTAQGQVLPNAPVRFQVTRGSGKVSAVNMAADRKTSLVIRTDGGGHAEVRFQTPALIDSTSLITVTSESAAIQASTTFIESIIDFDDSDGDGIPDGWEEAHQLNLLVDDSNEDPDNDGLTNAQEFQDGTQPWDADTDHDGIPDGWEVTHGLRPLVDDAGAIWGHTALTNLQGYQLSLFRVGEWLLDEGQGNVVADSSGHQNNGSLVNQPEWMTDPENGFSLLFNAPQSYVSVSHPTTGELDFGTASFSISLRFLTSMQGYARFLDKAAADESSGYFLEFNDGHVVVGLNAPALIQRLNYSSVNTYNDGQWHHLAAVIDQTTKRARLYVDGLVQELVKSPAAFGVVGTNELNFTGDTALNATSVEAFTLGGMKAGSLFSGHLDQVTMYNKALNGPEVKALADVLSNEAPSGMLVQPIGGSNFTLGTAIRILVAAVDSDGTPVRVSLFDGSTELASIDNAPFGFLWVNAPAGMHFISARITDNRGGTAWSGMQSFSVLADINSNGIPDEWELYHFGNLNQSANDDYDGDGVSNYQEYLLGRNPAKGAFLGTSVAVGLEVLTPLE